MADKLLQKSAGERQRFFSAQADLLKELSTHGQSPEVMYIGCSDARVVPEFLLGAKPGDLFVLRNVANIVPPYWQTEITISSALEFAVKDLHVSHIVICGHSDCGGILSLDQHIDLIQRPGLVRWLDLARPAQREIDAQISAPLPGDRHRAIVERNVINQLRNLQSYSFVAEAIETGKLVLHGWVYYLESRMMGFYDPEQGQFVPE